jgi:uncharacterized membrane protein
MTPVAMLAVLLISVWTVMQVAHNHEAGKRVLTIVLGVIVVIAGLFAVVLALMRYGG